MTHHQPTHVWYILCDGERLQSDLPITELTVYHLNMISRYEFLHGSRYFCSHAHTFAPRNASWWRVAFPSFILQRTQPSPPLGLVSPSFSHLSIEVTSSSAQAVDFLFLGYSEFNLKRMICFSDCHPHSIYNYDLSRAILCSEIYSGTNSGRCNF